MPASPPIQDDAQSLFGWCMYDWANSAYGTTVLAGLLGVYIAEVVAPEGLSFLGLDVPPTSLFAMAAAVSAALIFLIAPVLGAIADLSGARKTFLLFFAYTGALATVLLYFSKSGDVWYTLIVFVVSQTAFVAANVFYDAFLPSIASEEKMDEVSGRGYAYGYVGGGVQFLFSLLLVAFSDRLGITQQLAVRIAMLTAGLWWGGFTLFTVKYLKESVSYETSGVQASRITTALEFVRIGMSRTIETTRKVSRFRHLLLFLIAFLCYNDGIQTAILVTSSYGLVELGLSTTLLMVTLLIIQIVATGGAILFSRLAEHIGAKRAVMVSLIGWSILVICAYFLRPGQALPYMILGGFAGLVLGGSQALSRSLYGAMIPAEASAEFYGFYSVFAKFSAIWGPLVFALTGTLGSQRTGIISLIVFFLVGLVLLYFVDEDEARRVSAEGAF